MPDPEQLSAPARRGRPWRTALAGAAAVCVVVAGATWLARPGAPAALVPAQPVRQAEDPLQEAAAVWPQAVRRIPATLPDGRRFHPQALLDDGTLLVTTESSFEKSDSLWRYDLAGGPPTKVADVVTPRRAVLFAGDFTVGDGKVAWWTARKAAGGELVEIWTVPVTGGTPAVAVAFPARDRAQRPSELALADGGIVYSAGAGGLYRAEPGAGPQLVAGTEGQHLLAWPWIGSPGRRPFGDGTFASVRNLKTGQARQAASGSGRLLGCGATRCLHADAGGQSAALVAADGTSRPVPYAVAGPPEPLVRDRFRAGVVSEATGRHRPVLQDAERGLIAALGPAAPPGQGLRLPRVLSDGRTVVQWLGQQWLVVDLAAIP
ncbi:hypothetical protein [Nonomuraea sp. NPDC050310]|uniref:hypothetical protein n=1 Tax=Nonomuraea sp. NPDC050310 TaxID=3154935 RepID=UPI00340B990D